MFCSVLEHVTGCTSLTSANVGLSAKQVVSNEKELMQKWKVNPCSQGAVPASSTAANETVTISSS